MHIDYRQLLASECERISEIDPSTFVKRVWRKVDGVKQWIEINWQDEDFPEGYDNHLTALKETFKNGGFAIGAFDGERLIGFCSVNIDAFGKQYKYVLLDQIFISKEYKRNGIGRKLFYMSADQARRCGAEKFYICAGSSEDTLTFYDSLGCKEAEEINQVLYENDPNDVQLEYDLSNKHDYFKLLPTYDFFAQISDAPERNKINDLFSEYKNNKPIFQSVLDGNYEGSIYVDCEANPTWAVLQMPIGFHFTAGKLIEKEVLDDILFNRILSAQDEKQLIVFSPTDEWQPLLESIFKPRKGFIVPRKMFQFCHDKYKQALERQPKLPENVEIITVKERIDGEFCKNDEWISRLFLNGECVSTCTAPMTGGGYAEIGVETHPDFQGHGYATLTALALIQKLLEDSFIPCWSAWPYRAASQSLAVKVGFIPEPDVNAWLWDENECS